MFKNVPEMQMGSEAPSLRRDRHLCVPCTDGCKNLKCIFKCRPSISSEWKHVWRGGL